MKKEIAQKWMKALRSGEYDQCKGALKRTEGHCCLGVLTELYLEHTGIGEWGPPINGGDCEFKWIDNDFDDPELEKATESTSLPEPVQRWAGVKNPYGKLENTYSSLANANDGHIKGGSYKPLNFNEIADLIEKHVDEL